jgi:2-amino-4-hydroxy-6-hydroxymethyldihydropteridine diphosphokinase
VTTAWIGMGSNVGDRLETLTSCLFVLDDTDGITVQDVSAIYQTAPWGGVDQEPFLNAVVRIDTDLDAHALLAELQATEAAFGRDRSREQRWGPRTLDLDLLLFGDQVIDTPDLQVPHPRLTERVFVLVPLLEVMPGGTLPDGTRLTQAVSALAPLEGSTCSSAWPTCPARPTGSRGRRAPVAREPSRRATGPRPPAPRRAPSDEPPRRGHRRTGPGRHGAWRWRSPAPGSAWLASEAGQRRRGNDSVAWSPVSARMPTRRRWCHGAGP